MPQTSQQDLQALEQSRVALQKATTIPEIAALLAEVGYEESKIQEGKAILVIAQEAYHTDKQQSLDVLLAYNAIYQKKKALETVYRIHRRRAKVCLEGDPHQLLRLGINKAIPKNHFVWIDTLKKFYAEITSNPQLKTGLQTLNVSEQDLLTAQADISKMEALHRTYISEKRESQNTTEIKDYSLQIFKQWMRNFYAVAGIALKNQPQLMEVLGKAVKNQRLVRRK